MPEQTVDVQLVGGGNVDFSARDGRHGELQSRTRRVARSRLRAVIEFGGYIGSVIGVQHAWATASTRAVVIRVVDIPDDPVARVIG